MGLLDGFNLSETMGSFKQKTAKAMGTVKSDTLTPIDVTTKRLDDGIALTNPNDTSLKGTITSYRSSIVESLDSIVGSLSGGLLNTKAITKAIRIDENGVSLDTDALITSAGSALGYNVWGKAGVQQMIAGMLGDEFNRLTGLNLSQLIQVDNGNGQLGGFRVNGNWRGQMGMATMDMLRDYTGYDQFVDASVQSALYNSVIYNSSIFGMKDAYRKLWDNYPVAMLRQDAFITAIRYMITNGDIESIDEVFKLINQEGKNTLLNKYPDFIETLFTKFTFDKDAHPEDYPVLREKLLAILVTVAGPDWMYLKTELGVAYNVGLVSNISKDMVTLLSPVEELVPFLCCKGVFTRHSATEELNSNFPDAPISLL